MSFEVNSSRRRFLRTVVICAGSLGLGGLNSIATQAVAAGNRNVDKIPISFQHGVASGDPLADAVILWTRITPRLVGSSAMHRDIDVLVEVAGDEAFNNIVANGVATTDISQDFTVKFDVTGLTSGTDYFYRFRANGVVSPVGRTRTLPAAGINEVKFAVVSCINYPAGYFNVFDVISKRDDLDVVIHLGDYIYEYEADGYASEDAAELGRVSKPENELLTLEDYRIRYAQYHSDVQLQAAHARLPFILVWDDHDVADNAWENGAANHNTDEGDYQSRKAAAIQAWYEWLPIREPVGGMRETLYRRFDFGDLVSLYMLDTRHLARDKQLSYGDYFDTSSGFDYTAFSNDVTDPNRQLLGQTQASWLKQGLSSSGSTWQVLGQQVLIGRMELPAPVLLPSIVAPLISMPDYAALLLRSQIDPNLITEAESAILAAPSIPYNLDAWDGYSAEREDLFASAVANDSNLVVLSGDTHNSWANDLRDATGVQVGVEFAVSSVSSPGFESVLPGGTSAIVGDLFEGLVEPLRYTNLSQRGFMVVTFNKTEARSDWYYVDTVKSLDYQIDESSTASFKTLPGSGNRHLISA